MGTLKSDSVSDHFDLKYLPCLRLVSPFYTIEQTSTHELLRFATEDVDWFL
jgi:hypothetical protein